jgi:hypothetical protein
LIAFENNHIVTNQLLFWISVRGIKISTAKFGSSCFNDCKFKYDIDFSQISRLIIPATLSEDMFWYVLQRCDSLVDLDTEWAWFGMRYEDVFARLSKDRIDRLRSLTGIQGRDYLAISRNCHNWTAIHSIEEFHMNFEFTNHFIEILENNPNLTTVTSSNNLTSNEYQRIVSATPKLTHLNAQFQSFQTISDICSVFQGLTKFVLQFTNDRIERKAYQTHYVISISTHSFTTKIGPTRYTGSLVNFALYNTVQTLHIIEFCDFNELKFTDIYKCYICKNQNINTVIIRNCQPEDCGINLKLLCNVFDLEVNVVVNSVLVVVDI